MGFYFQFLRKRRGREKEKKGRRGRGTKGKRETSSIGWGSNQPMCPDPKSNQHPFGIQEDALTN